MNNRAFAILLFGLLSFGAMISAKPAFAHTFSGDESASFLERVEGLKVEINLIDKNLSNSSLVKWHVDKIGEFWTANDTKEVSERNQRVANDVTTGLDKLFSEVNKTNPNPAVVSQTASGLQNTLGEVVSVRIDKSALQNATVNALALRSVLDETLEDYGIATGVSEEASGGNSTSSAAVANQTAEATTGPAKIVNMAAYQTAQGLAASSISMFDKLKTMSQGNVTSAVEEIDKGLKDLQKAIADKASLDDVKKIVEGTIDPNLQAAFKLQVVPEFPAPLLMSVSAIAAVVAITRYRQARKAR
ncbi:MAG: hypothetical protein ABI348_10475 [Nitrososphaera sp.]